MPKFIVEVEEGMEMFEVSEDTEKLEYIDSDTAYKSAIHEALRNYGFDCITVKKIEEDTPSTGTDTTN